jgi:hypothetical protein
MEAADGRAMDRRRDKRAEARVDGLQSSGGMPSVRGSSAARSNEAEAKQTGRDFGCRFQTNSWR